MGWQPNQLEADFAAIHRALLAGLLGNVAVKSLEEPHYLGTRGLKLYLFPGSGLFKKPPKWLMAAELVETTRLYARGIAKINPEWIEQVAGHLCQHHYFEPHWEKTPAQVAAFERVTLYGLPIVPKRKVNYGAINPQLSREIFIRQALVAGEYDCTAAFFEHNRQLLSEIELLEHKARRQDILVDDEQIYAFYDAKIPQDIYSGRVFEKWLKQIERSHPRLLFLTREDLMKPNGAMVTPQAFPDYLIMQGVHLKLNYHFEPGHEQDGVTVEIPLPLLNQLTPSSFEWLVPGLLEEKIVALLRSLPKSLRKAFVPVPESGQSALDKLKKPAVTFREGGSFLEYPKESLREALGIYCQRRLGNPLSPDSWKLETLPAHLFMNFRLIDQNDHFVDMSRDLLALQQKLGRAVSQTCQQEVAAQSGLEKEGITAWNFGELPLQVALPFAGVMVHGFPTLIDQETHVALRVLDHPKIAQQEFRKGLRRLFLLALPTKKLLKQLAIERQLCLHYLKISPCEQLKQDLLIALIDHLFLIEPLPRNQKAFEQRLTSGQTQLLVVAQEYIQWLTEILTDYYLLTQQLARSSAPPLTLAEMKQHLQHLIYQGFIKEITLEQLKQLPRYLKAAKIRLDRLIHDPNKDAKKASQFLPLWQAYWQQRMELPCPELSEFRWMLEELRVSLFAQELKTAYPVSIQKVRETLQDMCGVSTN